MSFNDCKISESEIQTTGVLAQADTLTGSAADNKLVFDALPTLVIQKLNSLIDQLQQMSAAGQIGVTSFDGMTAQTLQDALEQIQADIGGNYGGADGAGKVGYTPSEGVEEDTVQAAIEAVQANLATYIAKIKAVTGAAEVGNAPIVGMTATNVQQALEELRENIDNIVSGVIPGGSITNDMLQGPVSVDKGGTGATTPQGALANLGAGVRPNLLDNAIFIGGGSQQGGGQLPVNQRGQTTGTIDWGYLIDRWKQFGADWQLTPNGVKFSPKSEATYWSVLELLENGNALSGKTLCASVLVDGALFSGNGILPFSIPTFALERVDVTLSGSTLTYQYYGSKIERTIQAAKLELGSTQTLAYQDDTGAWQLLPQPESDYATQLARCQRYYQIYSTADARPSKAVDCRPVMRTDPAQGTIVVGDTTYYYNTAEL